MFKFSTALIAALAAGWVTAGSATSASAHDGHRGCNCGPIAPTRYYKTIHPEKYYTHYHDVSVYKHVHRIHEIVNVTRIQPIIHIHEVTRVHHHTIVETRNAYAHITVHLPPIRYVRRSVLNSYDCHCGW